MHGFGTAVNISYILIGSLPIVEKLIFNDLHACYKAL